MIRCLYDNLSRAWIIILLLICLQQADLTRADYERTCSIDHRPHPRGFCGRHLVDMIGSLCSAFHNNPFERRLVKRNAEKASDDSIRKIMLSKKEALSFLTKRSTTGSIVCECCYHQCTVFELLQYCDLPPSYYHNRRRH